MATPPPLDPTSFFRDMLAQWESAGNEIGSKMLHSPEFAQMMGQGTNASMQMQTMVSEAMAKALATFNMPSKADLDAMSARLAAVEKQLHRIEARLDGSPADPSPRPAIARTKKPPQKTS